MQVPSDPFLMNSKPKQGSQNVLGCGFINCYVLLVDGFCPPSFIQYIGVPVSVYSKSSSCYLSTWFGSPGSCVQWPLAAVSSKQRPDNSSCDGVVQALIYTFL